MADSVNMKFKFLADASGIKKGASEANAAINNLTSNASSGLASLGAAFGIPSGALGVMQGLIGKASSSFTSLASTAASSASGINASFATVSGAIGAASAAVGVLAAGIASLNSVASHYEQTMEGEAIGIARKANVKTYSNAINDFYSNSNSVKTLSGVKQFFGKIIPTAKSFLLSGVGTNDLANSMRYANEQAKKSEDISIKLDEVEQEIVAKRVEQLDITNKMTEAQARIRDTSEGTADRQQAISEYQKLAEQRANLILPLLKQRKNLLVSLNSLTKSSWEDKQKELSAEADIKTTEGERAQAMASLVRYSNAVNNAVGKAANSTKKAKEWTAEWVDLLGYALDRNAASDAQGTGIIPTVSNNLGVGSVYTKGVELKIIPKLDEEALAKMRSQYQATIDAMDAINDELRKGAEDAIYTISEAFGTLISDVIAGNQSAFGNFGGTLLSGLGSMAQSMGKVLITAGLGMTGLFEAMSTPSPTSGIKLMALGAGLVAIGALVKQGLSNIASGSSYTSSSAAVTSSGSTSSAYSGSTLNISVNGTLKADGDQLVAVINSANNKKQYRA